MAAASRWDRRQTSAAPRRARPDPVNEAFHQVVEDLRRDKEAGILSRPGVRDALFLLALCLLIFVVVVFWTDLMVPGAWPNLIGPTE
jgi:hypothetical protein